MIANEIEEASKQEAISAFEREIGVTSIPYEIDLIGNRDFIKFNVGREAPLYTFALHEIQKSLNFDNPFKGAIGLKPKPTNSFPESIEASALLTLLTRSTREVSVGGVSKGYVVPYVPFQNREDHRLAQPASHIVRGRRGVGKSTLIRRAVELLTETASVVAVLDMQAYSTLNGNDLLREVMYDTCVKFADSAESSAKRKNTQIDAAKLREASQQIINGTIALNRAPITINRILSEITSALTANAYLFLDDLHLVDYELQPQLLHSLHAALKGANGWLKISGLSSLMNFYSPITQQGLQVPGDAQFISLDLTLQNPEAAETHLKAILEGFLKAVGYPQSRTIVPDEVFQRLAWANAGVPRDFLQMLGRSLEHAQRNRHTSITLSDVNLAIGEFGQQKMDDLQRDARNKAGILREMLDKLERLCLDANLVNAFLIRSEDSKERALVQILSDLRMVHLIHQSITPRRAGERYEAFILDYSLFTGFRRRPNVTEMIPKRPQFTHAELRTLPKVGAGFLDGSTSNLPTASDPV